MRRAWRRFVSRFIRPRQREQSTWCCYCPGCQLDLCSMSYTPYTDTDLVRYSCGTCGTRSEWLFDIVPILIRSNVAEINQRP